MLLQIWLLAILTPLDLGLPAPQGSLTLVTPSLLDSHTASDSETLGDDTSNDQKFPGRPKMGLNNANKAAWHLKTPGSKTTVHNQGSSSLGGYSARGTGVSFSRLSSLVIIQGLSDSSGTCPAQ